MRAARYSGTGMSARRRPLTEVNHLAIRLLSEQIGVVDTLRFVSQFTTGHGNYTEDRDALFGQMTLEEIVAVIDARRAGD
jgi:hypothetical protein